MNSELTEQNKMHNYYYFVEPSCAYIIYGGLYVRYCYWVHNNNNTKTFLALPSHEWLKGA